jgi:hypothetical protein
MALGSETLVLAGVRKPSRKGFDGQVVVGRL